MRSGWNVDTTSIEYARRSVRPLLATSISKSKSPVRIGLPSRVLRLGSAVKRRAASSNQSFFSDPAAILT